MYSEYTPMKLLKGGGSLILIQIEAAFYDESFAAIQACVFLFYCCVFLFSQVTEKIKKCSNLRMCAYSEVPRRVRKIPQLIIAILFQKCAMVR